MGFDAMLLAVYVGGALGISFLCSILEATLLSSRESELSSRAEHGNSGAARLLALKRDRLEDAIGAILTLNTIAHTIGAALGGAQAAVVFGDPWVGVFSAVLTLLVLVFTEIIPKTLGTVHAARLAGFVGSTITLLTRLLAPILFVTRALTRIFESKHEQEMTRGELAAVVAMATRQGTIKTSESQVMDNVLSLEEVKVSDVMTPRTVVQMLPETASIADLAGDPEARHFSRLPLYRQTRDEVVGYVMQREAFGALANGQSPETGLIEFKRDAWVLPNSTSLAEALREFLRRREHLALVVDEFAAVVGLVTLEDVMETVLGAEIVDESDRVRDMRKLALKLRDERLGRLRRSDGA